MASFHRFPELPSELRQEIYLHATPPRVVHVKSKFLRSSLGDMLRMVLSPNNQSPTDVAHWFEEEEKRARRLANKRRYFYSNAPIPVLLHTCVESRDFLMKMGYQITFGKGPNGARTWFHYDRDILLIQPRHGCVLDPLKDYVQLKPRDATRVRRLALNGTAWLLYKLYQVKESGESERWNSVYYTSPLCSLCSEIKDFMGLEELLLVDWTRNEFPATLKEDTDYPEKSPRKRHRYDTENLWKCVKVEDSSLLRTVYTRRPEILKGPDIYNPFDDSPAPGLSHWGTFDTRIAQLKSRIIHCQNIPDGWKMPRITPVHLIDERQEEILQKKQKMEVDYLHKLRREWARTLEERKARLDAGQPIITLDEEQYLSSFTWREICWIEKDIFSQDTKLPIRQIQTQQDTADNHSG
ncbi:hypothetical protein IL306_003327 [Fusarium sp. DS 682]|nr:hypothetical protein IL306_003327 [Fusarium sp. DS 682]